VTRTETWSTAISAIDRGDLAALRTLLSAHPELVRDRSDEGGEAYFARPYLSWFVAENPIRNGTLPPNIADVARELLAAAKREGTLREQVDYGLELVASGCVPREQNVQIALMDAFLDAGADGASALRTALPHKELVAARHLLARGTPKTLLAVASFGEEDAIAVLGPAASAGVRHDALMCAAVNGQPAAISALLALGVDLDAYGSQGMHSHTTALHQAVASGVLASVECLVRAGADRNRRDRANDGTALGWAKYFKHDAIVRYLSELTP
jgi:peptide-methionine (S)-S-oxide reductase